MKQEIYWSIYRNLEKELISLADKIHIDDNQLEVYSIKISELIIRCNVEIESISKDLYFENGGTTPDETDLYYDTDCLKLLEDKWTISEKVVLVTSPFFYFEDDKNKILKPLKKSYKRGTSGADWKRAYQDLKHNRSEKLKSSGNLKFLIRSLAALYLLNIYYRGSIFNFEKEKGELLFKPELGSSIFSIEYHKTPTITLGQPYPKEDNFKECTYLLKQTDESRNDVTSLFNLMNAESSKIKQDELGVRLQKDLLVDNIKDPKIIEENIGKYMKDLNQTVPIEVAKKHAGELQKLFKDIQYEAVLNKNQF